MSHFVASSIVITKLHIIYKGGDNNVVPRPHHECAEPRTPGNMRQFVRELLGGCIKPITSANDYFWWWLMRRGFWYNHDYNEDDHALDRLVESVMEEYDKRRSRNNCALYLVDANGKFISFVENRKGVYYMTKKPQRMTLYHACYLHHKDSSRMSNDTKKLSFSDIKDIRTI